MMQEQISLFPTLQKLLILEQIPRSYSNILMMKFGIIDVDADTLLFSHINGPGALAHSSSVGTVLFIVFFFIFLFFCDFSLPVTGGGACALTPCSI